jgi:hypothetical protein
MIHQFTQGQGNRIKIKASRRIRRHMPRRAQGKKNLVQYE